MSDGYIFRFFEHNLKNQIVLAVGDVHGEWEKLNTVIDLGIRQNKMLQDFAEKNELEIILLQCGDFGYWPHSMEPSFSVSNIKNEVSFLSDRYVKIYWCDGNHENHDALDELERLHPGPFIEIVPYVFFATFGAVLPLTVGNILFAGGAESIDRMQRRARISWWEQETIDEQDMAKLPDPRNVSIDMVISHTCPHVFTPFGGSAFKTYDPSCAYLEQILKTYSPKAWYFGHYHCPARGIADNCRWTALGALGLNANWWANVSESMDMATNRFSAFGQISE